MALTNANELADEVAHLLRHDNLDTRILTWLRLAYNDIIHRVPCWRFYTGVSLVHVLAQAGYSDEWTEDQLMGDPVAMIVHSNDDSNKIWVPRYISYNDFIRLGYNMTLETPVTADVPKVWTIGPSPKYGLEGTEEGKRSVYFYPGKPSGDTWNLTLYKNGPRLQTDVGGTSRYRIPYHFEHVMVWGAAALGAMALFPELYPVYQSEYEEALRDMQWVLTYKQDNVPILRSVTGPYEGTSRMRGYPRVPENFGT